MAQYLAIKVATYFADTQNTPTQPKRVERGDAGATQDVLSVPAAEGIPTEECSKIAKLKGARLNFPAVTASNWSSREKHGRKTQGTKISCQVDDQVFVQLPY
jgi:hypothetical protein